MLERRSSERQAQAQAAATFEAHAKEAASRALAATQTPASFDDDYVVIDIAEPSANYGDVGDAPNPAEPETAPSFALKPEEEAPGEAEVREAVDPVSFALKPEEAEVPGKTRVREMVNLYSFTLKPEEHQPSGTASISRIDTGARFAPPRAGSESIERIDAAMACLAVALEEISTAEAGAAGAAGAADTVATELA